MNRVVPTPDGTAGHARNATKTTRKQPIWFVVYRVHVRPLDRFSFQTCSQLFSACVRGIRNKLMAFEWLTRGSVHCVELSVF